MSDQDILTMLDASTLCQPDICKHRERGCACTDTAKRFRKILKENELYSDFYGRTLELTFRGRSILELDSKLRLAARRIHSETG